MTNNSTNLNKSNKYLWFIVCTLADVISIADSLISGRYTRTTIKQSIVILIIFCAVFLESHSRIIILLGGGVTLTFYVDVFFPANAFTGLACIYE
jgi:hypothetical protein